ncbi:hypothetical protein [Nitrospira sp. BLG_2]|uniref:hypothetical protein n=1 Tax=Nitrospira sp. BLG_2 TaxID=3397507 RepID=UPI003B9A89C7
MRMFIKQSGLVWAVLLAVVLANGFMAAPSVGHAEHDACHQTQSHSTGLCAWLCAGGVGIESSVVQFSSERQLLEWLGIPPSDVALTVVSLSYFFRGPPRLLA